MTMNLRSAIDAWKEAAADAQAAQELLDQMWRSYLDSRGPAVTDGLVKEVAQFRNRAEARLTLALALRNSAGDVASLCAARPQLPSSASILVSVSE